MKLYKVTLQGMLHSTTGKVYGVSYVVAETMDEAYGKVRSFLDAQKLGWDKERELHTIEVIAEEKQYGDLKNMLFI